MPTKQMSYPVVELKADTGEQGVIEAIVSVFGNVDRQGDRVVKGAFTKTIADWKAKNGRGRFMPFTDSHDILSREGRIGKVLQMAERDEGLWVKAQLFLNQASGRDMYNQIKEGVVGEFSFAYDIPPGGERKGADGANELVKLDMLDAAAAVMGANSATHLVSVKSETAVTQPIQYASTNPLVTSTGDTSGASSVTVTFQPPPAAKAGRMISAKNEAKLRDAVAVVMSILDSLDSSPQDAAGPEDKANEPDGAKADDPPDLNAEYRALLDSTESMAGEGGS